MIWSHHKITPAYNNLIGTFEDNNMPFANQMRLLRSQAGALGAAGFKEQNLRICHRYKHKTKKGQDGNLINEYFEYTNEMNLGRIKPNMYFGWITYAKFHTLYLEMSLPLTQRSIPINTILFFVHL